MSTTPDPVPSPGISTTEVLDRLFGVHRFIGEGLADENVDRQFLVEQVDDMLTRLAWEIGGRRGDPITEPSRRTQ